MTGKYLLDTCFIIGLQQHNKATLDMIQSRQILLNQCAYSVITRLELLSFPSLSATDEHTLQLLLNSMACLNLTDAVQAKTINIRKARKLKLPDAIILATAQSYGLELLTLDQKLHGLSQEDVL
ncbi:MAG: type II toxin-antitoxin system VapC family toxin [Pseudomonadota bacterium]|nr:type II toxin-antitoxin system VapC family toxin [Pseudomonadota bacterium]